MTTTRTGRCLCGAVSYSGEAATGVLHCHCTNCRRLTGNFIAAVRTATEDLVIDDEDSQLRWHELDYARYGFCQRCGATLFFQPADRVHTSMTAGTMDDTVGLELESVWFVHERQDHNPLPEGVPHHRGNA